MPVREIRQKSTRFCSKGFFLKALGPVRTEGRKGFKFFQALVVDIFSDIKSCYRYAIKNGMDLKFSCKRYLHISSAEILLAVFFSVSGAFYSHFA